MGEDTRCKAFITVLAILHAFDLDDQKSYLIFELRDFLLVSLSDLCEDNLPFFLQVLSHNELIYFALFISAFM